MSDTPKGTCLGEQCQKFDTQLMQDIYALGEHTAEHTARTRADRCIAVNGCLLEQEVVLVQEATHENL
jgi:hypothetical protein